MQITGVYFWVGQVCYTVMKLRKRDFMNKVGRIKSSVPLYYWKGRGFKEINILPSDTQFDVVVVYTTRSDEFKQFTIKPYKDSL